jgi:hypothetical protein
MSEKVDQRGRYKTCTSCGFKFKFQTKDEIHLWKKSNYECPSCAVQFCSIHETDRKLLALQEKYFKSGRNDKYIGEMYPILYDYTKSIILKSFRPLIENEEHLNDLIQTVISVFIETYYFLKPGGVNYSFGGLLFHKVREVVLLEKEKSNPKPGVELISLDFTFDDGNGVEYEDTKPSLYDSIENDHNKNLICSFITDLITSLSSKCSSQEENYIRLQGIYLYLKKGEDKASKFFEVYQRKGKFHFDLTLQLIKQELRKLY